MRRLALIVCLLIGTVAAHAQFEKGIRGVKRNAIN